MEFKVDGASLNVEVDGPKEAPAVLLWHGAACTLRMWDRVVERLDDRFFSIRFDVRGVGLSSPTADPDTQYTFEQYADDANCILDAYGVEKCHVWSMAWGTRAAVAYCSLNPGRVISATHARRQHRSRRCGSPEDRRQESLEPVNRSRCEPLRKPRGLEFSPEFGIAAPSPWGDGEIRFAWDRAEIVHALAGGYRGLRSEPAVPPSRLPPSRETVCWKPDIQEGFPRPSIFQEKNHDTSSRGDPV
ncbi:MAG: alpha/beta fold hydrolase [Proteobacteria bacterium]|nr:alpha/beta fold hydrolase [Pseudomonadota bacterium]